MSSSSSSDFAHPRLSCRSVRAWCALGGGAARHLASCVDCRAYFAASDALASSLHRAALDLRAPAEAARTARILRAVRTATAPDESWGRRFWSPGFAAGLLAAAAVVAVAIALRGPADTATRGGNSSQEARVLAAQVKSLSSDFVASVLPSAGEIVANNPMQQELDAIYADARSAWSFLALNFLPSAPQDTPGRSG